MALYISAETKAFLGWAFDPPWAFCLTLPYKIVNVCMGGGTGVTGGPEPAIFSAFNFMPIGVA